MGDFVTDQEEFWAGKFGDDYLERNQSAQLRASNLALFSRVLTNTQNICSSIEFGANTGLNLISIRQLRPKIDLAAVEINRSAVEKLKQIEGIDVYHGSINEFTPQRRYDFVFTKGVLIHLSPETLPQVYEKMYTTSSRYICVAEYYNPSPVEVTYRGHSGKLFKRDFAGELLEKYKDLRLIDYGFSYHRDPVFPQDDITWFLFEK